MNREPSTSEDAERRRITDKANQKRVAYIDAHNGAEQVRQDPNSTDGDKRAANRNEADAYAEHLDAACSFAAVDPACGYVYRMDLPGEDRNRSSVDMRDGPRSMFSKRFAIALSFPGERRDFVEQVASCLAGQVGKKRVLYDRSHEAEFARINLDTHLQRLYHDESELIVVFLCSEYDKKEWCGLEWRAIRDLLKGPRKTDVMLLRFDDATIPGLYSIDGYISIGDRLPPEISDLILQRLGGGTVITSV